MTGTTADRQAGRAPPRAPRRRLRRPLRVAARQVRPRGDRLPRGRERLHRGADRRIWRRCGRRSSTRSRPAPRRPTCRCPPAAATGGTTAAASRASSTACIAVARSADPDDWTPPQLDENTEIPGEQVLLDENVEAEGHDFFSLGAASSASTAHTLAYSVDVLGDERYTLRFKDLRTGELYDDAIVGIGAGATWAADNRTVYYVDRRRRVAPGHRVAPPPRLRACPPRRCYHEPDERFWLARRAAPAATSTSSSPRAVR